MNNNRKSKVEDLAAKELVWKGATEMPEAMMRAKTFQICFIDRNLRFLCL